MKTCFKKSIFKDYLKLICQDFIGKVENRYSGVLKNGLIGHLSIHLIPGTGLLIIHNEEK